MKRAEDFRQAIGEADAGFDAALRQTLDQLQAKEEPLMKRKWSAGLVLAAAIVLLTVTALAASTVLPGLLDMLWGEERPALVESMVQELTGMTAETPYARFSVRELIYDGQGVYVAVDLTPASDSFLLLPRTLDNDVAPNRPAAVLGLDADDKETVAAYAARTGKTMIYTALYLDSPTTIGLSMLTLEDIHPNGDGSWTITQRFILGAQEHPKMKVSCYIARLTAAQQLPEEQQNTAIDSRWFAGWRLLDEENDAFSTIQLDPDEVTPPAQVRTMAACEEVWTLRGVTLHNVTVTRTPVAIYLDIAYELLNEGDVSMYPSISTDADLYHHLGRPFIISKPNYCEGNITHVLDCYPLTEDIPDDLWLTLFVGRNDSFASRNAGTVHVTLK